MINLVKIGVIFSIFNGLDPDGEGENIHGQDQ